MSKKILCQLFFLLFIPLIYAQTPQPIKQFLRDQEVKGASFGFIAKEVQSGQILYSYNAERELTPASVMKLVTTATALELLGDDYRYPTSIEYDGEIVDGILKGNLYVKGSGDPTLGSSHFTGQSDNSTKDKFVRDWVMAIKKKGIRKITGSVIADESVFDTEGISLKWVGEDMGSYYGAGCYGLSIFDNQYKLSIQTGAVGSKPKIGESDPHMYSVVYHNYLTAARSSSDSSYIFGIPFAKDRYLYGIVPANKEQYILKGDIADPALYVAQYLDENLKKEGVTVEGAPTCYRILLEENKWTDRSKQNIVTTYSPTIREIVRITNEKSHNLFADALLKTIGLQYSPEPGEVISSFGRGVKVLHRFWADKGLDTSSLWMFDGSGLAVTDKLTPSFMCDLLIYMATQSRRAEGFMASLPQAGLEGSVRNFLKGSSLQGKALFKSGSMSRVKGYAGYITKGGKQYAVVVVVNNYSGQGRPVVSKIEKLLLSLF